MAAAASAELTLSVRNLAGQAINSAIYTISIEVSAPDGPRSVYEPKPGTSRGPRRFLPPMQVFRINAVGNDGRTIVLGTTDTATQALAHIHDAFDEYPRAWVTDEQDHDVQMVDLIRMAEEERTSTRDL